MNAAQFIGLLFLGRDVAHSAHLNTRSYARHKALNKFYEGIVGLADDFAETYQGRHGLIGPISLPKPKNGNDIVKFLEGQLGEIENGRFSVCSKDDSPLQNLIDEVCELYLRTIYKLRFLG